VCVEMLIVIKVHVVSKFFPFFPLNPSLKLLIYNFKQIMKERENPLSHFINLIHATCRIMNNISKLVACSKLLKLSRVNFQSMAKFHCESAFP